MRDATELRLSATLSFYETESKKMQRPIAGSEQSQIRVFFVYGADFSRNRNLFSTSQCMNNVIIWLTIATLLSSTIILYLLRHFVQVQRLDFVASFLDVFVVVFGGGSIRYRHRLEKIFFAITLIGAFFPVSLYLADFSMHSVLNEPQKVDTFAKLAKQNVTFRLTSTLATERSNINKMLW